MNIRRNFVGVVLIVTQITLLRAQDAPTVAAIAEDITGRNFYDAVTKIKKRGNLQTIMNSVIFRLNDNNNDESAFNLLLQFLDYKPVDTNISFATYQAVNRNIDLNNPKDYVKKLRLIKSFNSRLQFQQHFFLVEEGSKEFKDELHNNVSSIVLEDLKDALRTNNNDELSAISENIYKYYPELLKQVFKPALSHVFNDINVKNLIKFFLKHKHTAQNIYAFSAIFDELKKGNLNQALVVDLAFGLKEAASAGDDGDSEAEGELTKVKNDLPRSVRNLAFAEHVCIKNTNRSEYLYAASDGFNYDSKRRNVFTWIPNVPVGQGIWSIVRNDDVYLIQNQAHIDEYMYSSDSTPYTYLYGRNVFTWIPKGTDNNLQFNWKFEPFGDDVYIENAYFHEYLHATVDIDNDRRHVGTGLNKTKNVYSTWTVVDCSSFTDFIIDQYKYRKYKVD